MLLLDNALIQVYHIVGAETSVSAKMKQIVGVCIIS